MFCTDLNKLCSLCKKCCKKTDGNITVYGWNNQTVLHLNVCKHCKNSLKKLEESQILKLEYAEH